MKRILIALLPAAVLAFAGPALAQQKPAEQPHTTPLEGELAKQPSMATTQAAGNVDFGKVIDLMAEGEATAGKIQTISAVGSINVVQVESLDGGKVDVQTAYNAHMVPISALQASIAANTALNAKVAENNIEPTQIVAAEIEANGSVTIYIRNKTS